MMKVSDLFRINSDLQFNEQAKIESETTPRASLLDWVHDVCQKLFLAKGIRTATERIDYFVEELDEDGYSVYKRLSAERWILKGNWAYIKKELTLDDFYPTAKMMESFNEEFFTVGVLDLYGKIRNNFQNRYEAQVKIIKSEFEEQYLELESKNRPRNYLKMMVEVFKANSTADKYKTENEMLHKENEELKNRLDKSTEKLNQIIIKQNETTNNKNINNLLQKGGVNRGIFDST